MYNVDPAVTFWATPPIHGVLTPYVVHPANYTFKLPDNVSFAEGAMVEPFAVGMQAATKARITPGDTAVVLGAGPIGTMVALAALAGGCARVIIADLAQPKLDIAARYQGVIPVNIRENNLTAEVMRLTDDWGADSSSSVPARRRPGRRSPICRGRAARSSSSDCRSIRSLFDVSGLIDEGDPDRVRVPLCAPIRSRHRADRLGPVDLKPLITETFPFEKIDRGLRARGGGAAGRREAADLWWMEPPDRRSGLGCSERASKRRR